jgi:hypothetical protein
MDRKGFSATALMATALLFNHRPTVGGYSPEVSRPPSVTTQMGQQTTRLAARTARAAQVPEAEGSTGTPVRDQPPDTPDCAIGVHCDALVPSADMGPWTASCRLFGSDGIPAPKPAELVQLAARPAEKNEINLNDWCLSSTHEPVQLQFLLVTVPDPITTHLALYFDRTIEAIEAAAQLRNLYLSNYWLPWSQPVGSPAGGDTSEDLRVNQILGSFRTAQPGVMIFTAPKGSPDPGRITRSEVERATYVFLIGESPTSGINKSQFKRAVSYALKLCAAMGTVACPKTPAHVVGPFFSGSTTSAIELNSYLERRQQSFDFFSGTLSSQSEGMTLRRAGLRFDEALQDDQSARDFLLDFLQRHGLTDDGDNVAILQEEETQFGGTWRTWTPSEKSTAQLESRFHGVRYLSFPRELSRLRNASADSFGQPVASVGDAVLPSQGLTWNWHDVGKGVDSVPSFSDGQEPQSQQAILLSIAGTISQQNIKYVGIVATDIFDILFISRFLKMTAPNTRLFVLDSDLLMVKTGEESRELAGTLAVTSYPLIDRSDLWARHPAGNLASFPITADVLPSRIAKGIYNAVYFQLASEVILPKPGTVSSSADAPPPIKSSQPLWLTMVGRSGFWPVSLQQNTHDSTGTETAGSSPVSNIRLTFDPPDTTTVLLENALLLWGIIHLLGTLFAASTHYPWLAPFRVRSSKDRRRDAQYQTYYLTCGTLALSAMLTLVAISVACLWLHREVEFRHPWLSPLADLGRAVVGIALLVRAWWIARRNPNRFIRPKVLWYLPWFVYFLTIGTWITLNSGQEPAVLFFAQRTFYMSNGVSPLLPLEFLLLIYYFWSWVFIRKVRLSESKQVRVPELGSLGHVGDGFEGCCRELAKATDRLVFDPGLAGWIFWGFIAVVVLLLRPWKTLLSVEGRGFDCYFNFMVLYIWLLIVFVWGRYLFIWSRMRRLLRGLERTRLRRAFSRLPEKIYSWSPLWYEDAERRAYTISTRSLECFQAIVDRGGYGIDGPRRLEEMTRAFGCIVALDHSDPADNGNSGRGDEKCKAVAKLQRIFRRTAEELLQRRLRNHWAKEGGSDTLDEVEARRPPATTLTHQDKLIFLEEEFVALRYVGLIHYESAQLKNIVVLLVVGFVLALVSIGSYPFLGGRECVWSLAAVFMLFGVGIIVSFAQMARDAVLSRLSGTDPGKLDWSFFLRALSYGAVPVFALLASQFPSFGRSLFSWVQPALNAIH